MNDSSLTKENVSFAVDTSETLWISVGAEGHSTEPSTKGYADFITRTGGGKTERYKADG